MDKAKIKYLVGIYACALTFMAMLVPVPIVASIAQAFPGENIALVQMVVALPSLLMAITAMIVSSTLASRIYKKHIALFSGVLFMLAGLSPLLFHDSIFQLLAASAFVGIGLGGLQNSSDAIIADYFEGKQRSFVMGFFSTFVCAGGVMWTLLSANLGAENWVNAYSAYFAMAPFLVIAGICLPKGELEPKRKVNVFKNMPREVVIITFVGFVFTLAVQLYNSNVSLIVFERGMGGTIEAGLSTTIATFAGILAGFLVGPAFSKFKNLALPIMFCLVAVGLTVCLFAPLLVVLCIGGFIISLGKEMFTPLEGNFAAGNSTSAGRAFNLAIGMAGMNVGIAMSPIVSEAITIPFGSTIESKFIFGIVICVGLAVFGFKHYRQLTPAQIAEQERLELMQKEPAGKGFSDSGILENEAEASA